MRKKLKHFQFELKTGGNKKRFLKRFFIQPTLGRKQTTNGQTNCKQAIRGLFWGFEKKLHYFPTVCCNILGGNNSFQTQNISTTYWESGSYWNNNNNLNNCINFEFVENGWNYWNYYYKWWQWRQLCIDLKPKCIGNSLQYILQYFFGGFRIIAIIYFEIQYWNNLSRPPLPSLLQAGEACCRSSGKLRNTAQYGGAISLTASCLTVR